MVLEEIPEQAIKQLAVGFREELRQKLALSEKAQEIIAKNSHYNPLRYIDGLGQVRLSVDADMFYLCRRIYGEDCWKDKSFLRWIEREFPEYRVKTQSAKIQVGYGS